MNHNKWLQRKREVFVPEKVINESSAGTLIRLSGSKEKLEENSLVTFAGNAPIFFYRDLKILHCTCHFRIKVLYNCESFKSFNKDFHHNTEVQNLQKSKQARKKEIKITKQKERKGDKERKR